MIFFNHSSKKKKRTIAAPDLFFCLFGLILMCLCLNFCAVGQAKKENNSIQWAKSTTNKPHAAHNKVAQTGESLKEGKKQTKTLNRFQFLKIVLPM